MKEPHFPKYVSVIGVMKNDEFERSAVKDCFLVEFWLGNGMFREWNSDK